MYTTYVLQAWLGSDWVDISPSHNRPHYYDELRAAFLSLIHAAVFIQARCVGYRIMGGHNGQTAIVDRWVK